MSARPLGVSIVAWLTLFSSFALFFVFFMGMILLAGVGGFPGPNPSGFDWSSYMLAYPIIPASLVFSGCAFFLSIAMFSTSSKYAWYASILFWIGTLLFFSWWDYGVWRSVGTVYSSTGHLNDYDYAIVIATLLPLAYSIGCLIFFQIVKVKDYFMISFRRNRN